MNSLETLLLITYALASANFHCIISNFNLFEAATAFTDHVDKNRVPESQSEAEKLMYVHDR